MASLNAGPEYYAAEGRLSNAKTNEEKMEALQAMLRHCPKHKSAQSILMEIRTKMAKIRKEEEKAQHRKSARKSSRASVRKQGAAQVVFVGFVNSGKSALLNALTNAHVKSTEVPFCPRQGDTAPQ